MLDVKEQVQNENLTVLANAVEFGSRTILDIAGNEVSNAIAGEEITLAQANTVMMARLKASLVPATGA